MGVGMLRLGDGALPLNRGTVAVSAKPKSDASETQTSPPWGRLAPIPLRKLPFAPPAVAVGDAYFHIWAPVGLSAVHSRDTTGQVFPSLVRLRRSVAAKGNQRGLSSCRASNPTPLPHILSRLEG